MTPWIGSRGRHDSAMAGDFDAESGSAIAEYVMTLFLVISVFLVVCQFAYAAHVRSTVTMAASEGARYGARVGAGTGVATARTREIAAAALSPHYAQHVSAQRSEDGGVQVIKVAVTAPVPIIGPFDLGITMHTEGRSVVEERP